MGTDPVTQALNDMRRTCGGDDIPARLVKSTARLTRPFVTNHVR